MMTNPTFINAAFSGECGAWACTCILYMWQWLQHNTASGLLWKTYNIKYYSGGMLNVRQNTSQIVTKLFRRFGLLWKPCSVHCVRV